MKKHLAVVPIVYAAFFGCSLGSITLNYEFGIAYASDGTTPIPDGTLWVMVVDDGDGILPGGLEIDSSLNGNEDEAAIAADFYGITIAKGNSIGNDRIFDFGGMNGTLNFGVAGVVSGVSSYTFGSDPSDDFSSADVGKAFGFYWFPGISIDESLQLGTVIEVGGISDQTSSNSTERMVIPSNGATENPTASTAELGGAFSNERFTAIEVPPSGYQVWRDAAFTPSQIEAGEAAPGADPDGDGLANLVEYATGSAPLHPNPGPVALTLSEDALLLEFSRIADPELRYRVEATEDLSLSPWPDLIFESVGSDNLEELVQLSQPLSPGQRFFRLRVEQ